MHEIVMDGPGKNALGSGMMDFLLGELDRAQGAPVLLTGRGDAFCAGLNLKELLALDAAGMEAFLRKLERLVSALFIYPGPTVAAVNGHAIAGGCILVLCCDHRVARADMDLRMGLNEVALGLQFPPGILRMLTLRLSATQSTRALLGAALVRPDEAGALGYLDELTDGEVVGVARARLAALAKHPADAYAAAKRALRGASTWLEGDEEKFQQLLPAWTSQALKDRVAAVLKPSRT
jgi:enoyl-CoA hydratase